MSIIAALIVLIVIICGIFPLLGVTGYICFFMCGGLIYNVCIKAYKLYHKFVPGKK